MITTWLLKSTNFTSSWRQRCKPSWSWKSLASSLVASNTSSTRVRWASATSSSYGSSLESTSLARRSRPQERRPTRSYSLSMVQLTCSPSRTRSSCSSLLIPFLTTTSWSSVWSQTFTTRRLHRFMSVRNSSRRDRARGQWTLMVRNSRLYLNSTQKLKKTWSCAHLKSVAYSCTTKRKSPSGI